MRFTAIETASWEALKRHIRELTQTMRTLFGEQAPYLDLLHNGDVCQILGISKRTLQHYRDTGVVPFIQIGHKCYYKRADIEVLLAKSNSKQACRWNTK